MIVNPLEANQRERFTMCNNNLWYYISIGKLRQYNAELDESCRRADDDIALLEELLYAVIDNKVNRDVTAQQSDVLREILLQWPMGNLNKIISHLYIPLISVEKNEMVCDIPREIA